MLDDDIEDIDDDVLGDDDVIGIGSTTIDELLFWLVTAPSPRLEEAASYNSVLISVAK